MQELEGEHVRPRGVCSSRSFSSSKCVPFAKFCWIDKMAELAVPESRSYSYRESSPSGECARYRRVHDGVWKRVGGLTAGKGLWVIAKGPFEDCSWVKMFYRRDG